MNRIAIGRHCGTLHPGLDGYRRAAGDAVVDEIRALADTVRGLRICHVNSTAAGGGVAELLGREVPVLRALGIEADWQIIQGDERFFTVTKGFHNALQGAPYDLSPAIREIYLGRNQESAQLFTDRYDVYVVHDPQPAALCRYRRRPGERWIWRCHIDSSAPAPGVWEFLRPIIGEYDAAVFTMREFVPPDLALDRLAIIPPAIDPLSSKNMALPSELCRRAMADYGVDVLRPIVLQVSRFDPWKDPLGVIQAYRLAREEISGLQLVLIGALAGDDPEGLRILEQVEEAAGTDPDILVFTNMTGIGNMEVNVFQRGADLIVQKSLKEGFGLVVSEALWKAKAVVGGNTGGIPMQIPPPYRSYLVETVEECARTVGELLADADARHEFGEAGRRHVAEHFLLPRLIRDELRLIRALLEGREA